MWFDWHNDLTFQLLHSWFSLCLSCPDKCLALLLRSGADAIDASPLCLWTSVELGQWEIRVRRKRMGDFFSHSRLALAVQCGSASPSIVMSPFRNFSGLSSPQVPTLSFLYFCKPRPFPPIHKVMFLLRERESEGEWEGEREAGREGGRDGWMEESETQYIMLRI